MKAAAFEYSRPRDLDEACALLAAEDGARAIAGGQTLVPLMAMRLARPTRLVDVARLTELSYIRDHGDTVEIGAATRQCIAERDPIVARRLPLLALALPWVGHTATRARGTVGGSLANADPAAEISLAALTLDAALTYRDVRSADEFAAADFFLGPMITALPAAACLTGVRFPVWPERRVGAGFHEVSARKSDFAFASAAAQVALDDDGVCRRIAIGIGAVGDTPVRLANAESALVGSRCEQATVRDSVIAALRGIETSSDLHASANYRRRVGAHLAARAVADAVARAIKRNGHAG
jgi:carbon-monoxide dehydrogenase medium subunit